MCDSMSSISQLSVLLGIIDVPLSLHFSLATFSFLFEPYSFILDVCITKNNIQQPWQHVCYVSNVEFVRT